VALGAAMAGGLSRRVATLHRGRVSTPLEEQKEWGVLLWLLLHRFRWSLVEPMAAVGGASPTSVWPDPVPCLSDLLPPGLGRVAGGVEVPVALGVAMVGGLSCRAIALHRGRVSTPPEEQEERGVLLWLLHRFWWSLVEPMAAAL
jgi:hypothetical protein